MKIFISWSGERSRAVAEALRSWLPDLIEGLEPWAASMDIEAGERWNASVGSQLESTGFGVLCVTRKNATAPWLLFEAGALSKSLSESKVIPYLVDILPADLEGPLRQFQAVSANEEGTLRLVKSIQKTRDGNESGLDRLQRIFPSLWPRLDTALQNLPSETREPSTHELVKQCLEILNRNSA
jgi:hypothetical protein